MAQLCKNLLKRLNLLKSAIMACLYKNLLKCEPLCGLCLSRWLKCFNMLYNAVYWFYMLYTLCICLHTLLTAFIRFFTLSYAFHTLFIRFYMLSYAFIRFHTLFYAYTRHQCSHLMTCKLLTYKLSPQQDVDR